MKKVNFNSAKNIPVPDEWIEKALTLSPPAHESKKQTRKKAYLIATAASIVAAVALAAFLSETLVTPKIQSQLSATISQSTPTFVTSTNPFETVPQEFQEDTSAAQIASVCEITVTEPQEEMTDLFDTDENIVEQTEKEMTEPFYNSFVEETTVPVVLAGSVNSYQRLDEVKDADPWAFTIGGAFFENKFDGTFAEQINKVVDYMENCD